MGLNLTVEGKKDNHHFLDLQEGRTPSNTPTGMLPTGWKAICLSAIRRIKPTSETKLNSEEEPAGECNGLFVAASKSTLLLGTSAKDQGMGFALPLLWQTANVQSTQGSGWQYWPVRPLSRCTEDWTATQPLPQCFLHYRHVSALLICPCGQITPA